MNNLSQSAPLSPSAIIQNSQIEEINGLRGVAILATVYCHAVGNFFQPGGPFFNILDWRIGDVSLSLAKVLDSGALGVELFFFLSAFVLYRPYVVGTRRMESRRDVMAFLGHRAARLFPLYFICGLISLFIVHRFNIFNISQWTLFGEFLTASHIFDPSNFMPAYNWVFWSVNIEIWFGFIFPILVIAFRVPLAATIILSLLPVAVWGTHTYFQNILPYVSPLWPLVASHLPSFALGMFAVHTLARHPVQRQSLRRPLLLTAGLLILMGSRNGITAILPIMPGTSETLAAAFGFYLLFTTVTRTKGRLNTLLCSRWLQVLGMMCYSIYVWHGNMMAYIMGQDPTPGGRMFLMLPYLPLLLAVCALSYRYIEFPGRKAADLFLLRRRPDAQKHSTPATAPLWTDRPAWANGLSGVAILVVLASHFGGLLWRGTGPVTPTPQLYVGGFADAGVEPALSLMASGRVGVDLLIVLAAFLLYRPFADGRQPMDRAAAMACYRWQAKRLLPLYGFCGLVSFVLSSTFHPHDHHHWRWMAEYLTASHVFSNRDFMPAYNWAFWLFDLAIWGSLIFPALVLAFRYAVLPTILVGCLLPWGIPLLYSGITGTAPSAPLWTAVPAHATAAILGMTAAWVLARVPDIRSGRWQLLVVAALLVGGGIFLPGPAGVVATSAGFAVVVVTVGATPGWLNSVLGWWPLQWLGLMAVSLYAWHLVVAHRLIDQGGVTLAGRATTAAVTLAALLVIAALSYRFIEFGHRPIAQLFPRAASRKAAEPAEITPVAEVRPPVPA